MNVSKLSRPCCVFLFCLIFVCRSHGQTDFGSISGIVDSNAGPIFGQTIRLFVDDGDGIFEPISHDRFAFHTTSGIDGRYRFDGLDPQFGYFLQSGATTSDLIDPGVPNLQIDNFEDTHILSVDPNNRSSSSQSAFSPTILAGERDVDLSLKNGLGEVVFASNRYGLADSSSFKTGGGVNGRMTITYDGVDGSAGAIPEMGLNGIDLTDGGSNEGVVLKMGFDNSAAGELMTLRIYQGDATNFSEATVSVPITGGSAMNYAAVPFDQFVGPVDPTNVDAIQLIFDPNNNSIDGQIDQIGVYGSKSFDFRVALVPEPSLCGFSALVALIFLAHRRKSVRTVTQG